MLLLEFFNDGAPVLQRLQTLCAAHRSTVKIVRCAQGNLGMNQLWSCAKIMVHTRIGNEQGNISFSCEHINGRAAGKKILGSGPIRAALRLA